MMIYLNQAVSLALIYTYRATYGETTMISYEKTREYMDIVNDNLKKMKSKVNNLTTDYSINPDDLFFTYETDINNNGYYVLKNDEISILKRKRYIMTLLLDIVLASQKGNALEVIDLIMIDGKIIKKDNISRVLNK